MLTDDDGVNRRCSAIPKLDSVTKFYGTRCVLDGVSLDVSAVRSLPWWGPAVLEKARSCGY